MASVGPAAQDPSTPTFSTAVDVVPISAVVRDGHGRMVTTLGAPDFEVFEKGERRRLVDFQVDRSSAITLAVLVDTSGSMSIGPKLRVASQVIANLTSRLQTGRDELGVFMFDSRLREAQPFTSMPAAFDTSLEDAEPFGTTSLYDAIAATAQRLADRASLHRAIVVLSDGVDTSSTRTIPEVAALVGTIDVPVYVVATVPAIDRKIVPPGDPRGVASESTFEELAQLTGGMLFWTTTEADALGAASQIITELRHQYLMAIESSNEQGWRAIDVRVRNRRLVVRARTGYFARNVLPE
jgi:tight adherence protein B